jgi:prophage regulatory protein
MRFLRVRDVVRMVGFSKTTLYARVRAGTFPKPIALGPQTTAFLESDVVGWMKTQIEEGERSVSFRELRAKKAVESQRNTAVSS